MLNKNFIESVLTFIFIVATLVAMTVAYGYIEGHKDMVNQEESLRKPIPGRSTDQKFVLDYVF